MAYQPSTIARTSLGSRYLLIITCMYRIELLEQIEMRKVNVEKWTLVTLPFDQISTFVTK